MSGSVEHPKIFKWMTNICSPTLKLKEQFNFKSIQVT